MLKESWANAHICHISPQARTCLFHNNSMKQQNCMCGHSNKRLLWCGITIWAKWAMKASVRRQNSTARSPFPFKLIALVLPVWETNCPQFTCSRLTRSAKNQLYVWSVFKCLRKWACETLASTCVPFPFASEVCASRSHKCCWSVARRAEQKLLKAFGPRLGRSSCNRQLRFWDVCSACKRKDTQIKTVNNNNNISFLSPVHPPSVVHG